VPSNDPSAPQDVARFFDEHQAGARYRDLKSMTRLQDQAVAARLNAEAQGEVLSIGGLWEGFARGPQMRTVTVLDLSPRMLETYGSGSEVTPVVGDLYRHDFGATRFDTVVFALILHHVAEGSWRHSEARVTEALSRGAHWLKPGGQMFVLEYCPHPAWMPVQRRALPVTRQFLKRVGQPLVVMHDRGFYEQQLSLVGLREIAAEKIAPPGFDERAWFPVFMATPWLKMPVKLYPKMHLFSARKPARGAAGA